MSMKNSPPIDLHWDGNYWSPTNGRIYWSSCRVMTGLFKYRQKQDAVNILVFVSFPWSQNSTENIVSIYCLFFRYIRNTKMCQLITPFFFPLPEMKIAQNNSHSHSPSCVQCICEQIQKEYSKSLMEYCIKKVTPVYVGPSLLHPETVSGCVPCT